MKKVRVFLTLVVLAIVLYVTNTGPVAAADHDLELDKLSAGDGAPDDLAPSNIRPAVDAGGPYSGDEGSVVALSDAAASDPDGDTLTYSWSVNTGLCTFDDPSLLHPNLTCSDEGEFTAELCVSDRSSADVSGACRACDEAKITIENLPPKCERISADPDLVPVDAPITFSAGFSDPGVLDTHTAVWDWGDGISSPATVTQGAGSGSVKDEHSYGTLGLYTSKLVVSDNFPAASNECTTDVCVYGPIFVSPQISLQPVPPEDKGKVFYTTTATVPELVPGCPECYCLSSQPDECVPMVVDDVLDIFLEDGTKIFEQDFAPRCQVLRRYQVKLPQSVSEQLVGQTITIQYRDKCGTSLRSDEVWLVPATCGDSPIVDAGEYDGCEGSVLDRIKDSTAFDPDGDTLTYSWSLDSGAEEAGCTFDDPSLLNPELTCLDDGEFTATLTVDDGQNPSVTDDAPVTVCNLAPTCGSISADPDLVPVNTAITFSAGFSDPGVLDTHTAAWDWGDGTSSAGTVTQGAGSGSVKDEHSYSTLGVYTSRLTVTDDFPAASDECTTDVCVYGPVFVGESIPLRDAAFKGEIFYTNTVTVPELVPGCPQCYCLSSQPDRCERMVVDDVLAIFLEDGTKIFEQDFAPGCQVLRRYQVKLPQTVSEQLVGQTVTIQYRDKCGTSVRSDEVWLVPAPCLSFPIFVSNAIPGRPADPRGETFFTTSMTVPDRLPEGGSFYLSSQPDAVTEIVIDDMLAVLFGGTEILRYDFSSGCAVLRRAIVEVPRIALEQLAGRTVEIQYRDVCGGYVRSDAVWLIWIP